MVTITNPPMEMTWVTQVRLILTMGLEVVKAHILAEMDHKELTCPVLTQEMAVIREVDHQRVEII